MEEQELREMTADNRQLEGQLTKRNEQYIFDLKKSLVAANLSEELQTVAMNEILPKLVDGQKTGVTARQLFGTVSEKTSEILTAPVKIKDGTVSSMWLSNSLLIFAFLSVMGGVLPLITKSKNASSQQQGIITMIVAAISGGYAFYLIYKYVYRFDRPGVDQTGRPGTIKSMFMMMGILLAWMAIFIASALIPPTINVSLDPVINIVLAAISFGAYYFLKKKYGFRGTIFSR